MYYKLTDYAMQSCIVTGEYRIQYCFGGWVRPEIGKILVFNSLNSLQCFAYGDTKYKRAFECSAMNPTPLSVVCNWMLENHFKKFWNGSSDYNQPIPFGTVGCDAVLLTREITDVLQTH